LIEKGNKEDEAELKKTERKLSTLLGNLPGLVYRCENDKDWTMRYLSDACVDLTGYGTHELIDNEKLAWADLIHPEDREKVWESIQESVRKNDRFNITYRIFTKEGEERWVWEQGKAIKDQEGDVEALEGFVTDITEKVETKKALEEREKKVKELYEATTRLERCKREREVYDRILEAAEDILGFYTSCIFIEENGELVAKARTETSGFEIGDSFSIDEGMLGRTFRTGKPLLVKDVSKRDEVEVSIDTLKSGIDVPIGDKGVLAAASEEVDHFDEFDLEMANILTSHMSEVMDRIESEKEKSLILDSTAEHIIYHDEEHRIKWANRAAGESVGKDPEDLVGKKCHKIWGDKEEPCQGCPVTKALETGEIEKDEVESPDGRYWFITATPVKGEEGEIKGVVEVSLDITERVEAREELKERRERIEGLLEATSKIEKQKEMENIYETAIDAVENILKIDLGAIFVLEGDKLVLKAETSGVPPHDKQAREKDDGMLGKTFKIKEPDITDDIQNLEDANLHFEGYRSGISVPIGDFGVFQAMSKEKGHFDEKDLKMLELLSNHISEAKKRVKFHKELKKSEKRYRTIFENTGTAMCIIESDKTISLANEEFQKATGYSSDELEGKKRWTEFVLDEDLEKMEEYHRNRREGDKDVPGRYSFRAVNRFGDVRHFLLQVGLIPDTEKTVASLMDVTDYKKTFGALRESQEAFRTLFENGNDPVVLIKNDRTIKEVNEQFADLVDRKVKELIGKSCDELVHPEHSKKVKKELKELFSGEKEEDEIKLDIVFVPEEEKSIALEGEFSLVKDNSGEPLYAIGICSKK